LIMTSLNKEAGDNPLLLTNTTLFGNICYQF
jgi:hypothetical protein